MPVRFASAAIPACAWTLSPPSSAKPEEMMMACLTPTAAQSSSTASTARAGMMTIARSTGRPTAPIDG